MAKALMIQGTMSNAGKSIITAGLCRIFKQDGCSVAPFKSQNMALNSYITREGLEMGRAQVVQAEAAGAEPSVLMNPILLKPTTDVGSQVIVNGEVLGNRTAQEYYALKPQLIPVIRKAFDTLAAQKEVIVIEGAGSPAEINLNENDIVNMGMAKIANAPVLLVGDIDRGGVFAQLFGTVALLPLEDRKRVKGFIINKFRGDVKLLEPGLQMLQERMKEAGMEPIPFVGVVPYARFDIDDEDSLSECFQQEQQEQQIVIAVVKLPRISNFTDVSPFTRIAGVSVRYVTRPEQLAGADMILLPGTKSTMADLQWMRDNGLETAIKEKAAAGVVIMGICGGFQMLGEEITDESGVEGRAGSVMRGMELLPVKTTFAQEKTRAQRTGKLETVTGVFAELSNKEYRGYEIHMGVSGKEGVLHHKENVYGTYVHGFFDEKEIAETVVAGLCRQKGIAMEHLTGMSSYEYKEQQYEHLAELLRQSLDMNAITQIMKEGVSE